MKIRARSLIPALAMVLLAACGSPGPDRNGSDAGAGGRGTSGNKGDGAAGVTCPSPAPGESLDCPTSDPIIVDPGEDPSARPVEVTSGLQNVNMTSFDKHRVVDGDRLKLFFWGGVEDCYGIDRVDIEYGRDVVIATIFYGNKPDAEVCIEIAEYQVVTVQLEEPVGGRDVVDGSLAAT